MALKQNQKIVLYMNDGVPCGEYKSLTDAYNGLQECKRQDKEYESFPTYYFELEEETEDTCYVSCIKIYKRGNKIFGKRCEYPKY